MTDYSHKTLIDGARAYIAELADDERLERQAEVERFARWCGADRTWADLTGHDVAMYGDTIKGSVTDATARANAVKKFLGAAKKAGYTKTNLGTHIRVKKSARSNKPEKPSSFEDKEITEAERDALAAELESLKAQRPQIIADIQRAREDKDFRENAPLDAARERQGYIEGRIQKIEMTLDLATIVVEGPSADSSLVEIGSTVILTNLSSEAQLTYTLVRPGEIDASQGRISFESPVGTALLRQRVGAEVQVEAPSGTIRLRIDRVES